MTARDPFRNHPLTILPLTLLVLVPMVCGASFGATAEAGFAPDHNEFAMDTAPAPLNWRHGLLVGGSVAVAMLLDDEIRSLSQSNRTRDTDSAADAGRPFGKAQVGGTIAALCLATGFLSDDGRLIGAGTRLSASLALAGILSGGTKYLVGRSRPAMAEGSGSYEPFSDGMSLPSGHTTMAFALATSLAYEIDKPGVSILLATLATATAWSRVNDDSHWFSDVVLGAAVGYGSARFVHAKLYSVGNRTATLRPSQDGMTLVLQQSF